MKGMTMDAGRIQSLFGLEGKRAVVTGGSRGVGYMIADGLLDAGCEVIISARKVEQVVAAADKLSEKGTCVAVPCDLSTDEGISLLTEAIKDRWDRLDLLFNNAGASWGEPLETFSTIGWDKVMNVNLRTPFFLTQSLLPLLKAAATPDSPARVINTASVNGLTPPEMDTFSYSSSKAGLIMLTRHLAKQLASDHITVNAMAPGPFESNMMRFALDDPKTRAAITSDVPLGRIGRPDDIAGLALYLASRASSYVTGVVIAVAGGLSTVAK